MSTPTPPDGPLARAEKDPSIPERPAERTRPIPGVGAIARTWVLLTLATVVVNAIILGIASSAGASMTASAGGAETPIGLGAVAAVSAAALLVSTVVWGVVATRTPAFANLWVPLGWGVGLVSLALIIGASGVTTGVALGAMHLVTTAAAANVLPRMLPRT